MGVVGCGLWVRWRSVLCSVGVSVVGCAGVLSASVGGSPASAAARAPSFVYLYSLPAAGGSLRGRDDRHLTLRLLGTRDYLTRFTDRPARRADVVYARDFVRRFRRLFRDSNPNAVLSYTPAGGRVPVSIVLTIGHPRWDAKRAAWTFPAVRLRKGVDDLPDSTRKSAPPYIPNPRMFGQATLLINTTVNPMPVTRRAFDKPGTYTWTSPGTGTVTFDVFGAQGGSDGDGNPGGAGGAGGEARATFAASAGQMFEVVVGGNPSPPDPDKPAGFNGGGAGYFGPAADTGGGGGASDVRLGARAAACAIARSCGLQDRIVVGGGGGGGGYDSACQDAVGGDGGGVSGRGPSESGGTQTHGGITDDAPSVVGSFGRGADALGDSGPVCSAPPNQTFGKGGGGGGWFGGGDFGGGSGYLSPAALSGSFPGGTESGDGKVIVTTSS